MLGIIINPDDSHNPNYSDVSKLIVKIILSFAGFALSLHTTTLLQLKLGRNAINDHHCHFRAKHWISISIFMGYTQYHPFDELGYLSGCCPITIMTYHYHPH